MREMTQNDFLPLCEMLCNAEVMQAYGHAFSVTEAQEWLNKQTWRYAKYGYGLWAVCLKASGRMIGQCGVTVQDVGGKEVLEVGYLFNLDYWHRGFATEAAVACKNYAFDVLHVNDVYSIVRDNNFASQAVAKRNGMQEVGSFIKHYYGTDMPHIVYKVSATEQ